MTPLQAAAHFAAMIAKIREAEREALEKAAKIVAEEARKEIGDYQPAKGPFEAWKELAESTKAERSKAGFTPNDPLLRTGKLRNSIEHQVEGDTAHVGSNNPIAVYQELGTSRIPPRSFLGGAAFTKEAEVKAVLGEDIIAIIEGKRAI